MQLISKDQTIVCREIRNGEVILQNESRYTESEMQEVFTPAERAKLNLGEIVKRKSRYSVIVEIHFANATVLARMALDKAAKA